MKNYNCLKSSWEITLWFFIKKSLDEVYLLHYSFWLEGKIINLSVEELKKEAGNRGDSSLFFDLQHCKALRAIIMASQFKNTSENPSFFDTVQKI